MYWPYVALIVVFGGLLLFSQRNRRRHTAQQTQQISTLALGTEIMTTSGLYGTVVARNDDGTLQLSIAPGVEVKWAAPAVRTIESLPPQYREVDPSGDSSSASGPLNLAKPSESHDDDQPPPEPAN